MHLPLIIYRHSNIIAVLGIITCGLILYLPIKNSINLFFEYRALSLQLQNAQSHPPPLQRDYTFRSFASVDLNKTTFAAISESAKRHNVTIKQMGTPVSFTNPGYSIETEEVTLEGDFLNLLRCVDDANAKLDLIKLSSAKFERDQSLSANALYVKLYFQAIKKEDGNK
jgi:hypothetical protein